MAGYNAQKIMEADQVDLEIVHHFSESVYAKEMHLPKGAVALSHKHTYSHLSILAKGRCIVFTDDTQQTYEQGACIEIKAGVDHQIEALEDVVWFCIHADLENMDV